MHSSQLLSIASLYAALVLLIDFAGEILMLKHQLYHVIHLYQSTHPYLCMCILHNQV